MSIASQVVILFLVVLVGALCRKLRFFTDETIRGVTQLVVNITLPVLTVYNMQRPFETRVLINFLLTLGCPSSRFWRRCSVRSSSSATGRMTSAPCWPIWKGFPTAASWAIRSFSPSTRTG